MSRARKPISGFLQCEICGKDMPYRETLNVRGKNGVFHKHARFCSNKCKMHWRNVLENPTSDVEVRLKISEFRRNNYPSHLWTEEAIRKRQLSASGENHWNWQGGKTGLNKKLRNCAAYQRWRQYVLERDGYKCKFCGAENVVFEVDHIIPMAVNKEKMYDVDNGRVLCQRCHRKTDTYGGNTRPSSSL